MNAEALSGMVLGTCTLQRLIGRGGMGAVFLAQQSRPRRQVAVKVLLPMVALQPSQRVAFLERFRREADAAASLEHPNIVPVHEYGEREGLAYLVMTYVSGGTLREEMEREGKLPLPLALSYLEQMAGALDFAHGRNVIHRDIKPANILLTPEKRLLLTDFGLVKIVDGDANNNPLSEAGMPMGTPDYMSPEQVIGGEIDARADIYSLGVILYQMVTGTIPFKGEMPMKVALQHVHATPPPPRNFRPDLPAEAEKVLLQALAKRPEERFVCARDFAVAFRQALEMAGVQLGDVVTTTTTTLGAIMNERPVTNRRRSLFDPVWRNATPATAEGGQEEEPATAKVVAADTAYSANQAQREPLQHDIVAKTSMTLPSFSGLLGPGNFSPLSLREKPNATKALPAKDTPLPATSGGGNQTVPLTQNPASPLQPLPLTQNPASPLPRTVDETAQPATKSIPGAPRLRGKTNLLGEKQGTVTRGAPTANMQNGVLPAPSPTHAGAQTINLNPLAAPAGNMPEQSTTPLQTVPTPGTKRQTGQLSDAGIPKRMTGSLAADGAGRTATGALNGQEIKRTATGSLVAPARPAGATGALNALVPATGVTGALMVPSEGSNGQTGALKLMQPVKVVKVPVAGQPGQYVTGLLPVLPQVEEPVQDKSLKGRLKQNLKTVILLTAVLLILFSSGAYLLTRGSAQQANHPGKPTSAKANVTATAAAHATATALANIILPDSLAENAHNWPSGTINGNTYTFTGGTYHITRTDPNNIAIALLPDYTVPEPFAYTVTWNEVNGTDDSTDATKVNLIGLVLRYTLVQKDGKSYATFYSFEVNHTTKGAQYAFRKYDDSVAQDHWYQIWHTDAGDEYHLGHGSANNNTVKVIADGDHFTFIVNGKQVGDTHDGSLKDGQIGMLVNLQGTEVSFSNLLLTHK